MQRSLLISTCFLCLFVGWWLGSISQYAESLDDDPARPILPRQIASFALTDHRGHPFDLERLRGGWTLIYLGYTSCPDVCPITLQELARLRPQIEGLDLDMPLRFLFVSVDPARDKPARLREYLGYFDSTIIGATASNDKLAHFAQQLDLAFVPVTANPDENYTVDHSAGLALVNPRAELHAIFDSPHYAGVLQARLIPIMKGFSDKSPEPE